MSTLKSTQDYRYNQEWPFKHKIGEIIMETNSNSQANNEVLSNIQSFGKIFSEEEQRLRKQYGLEKIMDIMQEYDITVFDLESDI
jgi:bisphosphoglycerate-dependent phosphoglycerate mutase